LRGRRRQPAETLADFAGQCHTELAGTILLP